MGVEGEHENAKTGSAAIANVPDGPRLGHISHSLRKDVVQQDASGVAADERPDGAPALGGGCEKSWYMPVLKVGEHGGQRDGLRNGLEGVEVGHCLMMKIKLKVLGCFFIIIWVSP